MEVDDFDVIADCLEVSQITQRCSHPVTVLFDD